MDIMVGYSEEIMNDTLIQENYQAVRTLQTYIGIWINENMLNLNFNLNFMAVDSLYRDMNVPSELHMLPQFAVTLFTNHAYFTSMDK